MGNPYVGEIRLFAGNYAPTGWAFCDGATLPIAENDTLFNLIGTTYGGDGQETFNLPDLRGRAPVHQGAGVLGENYVMGEYGGVENVTLTLNQLPVHDHGGAPRASTSPGTRSSPAAHYFAANNAVSLYSTNAPNANLNGAALSPAGGSQPHDNMQPFLCVSFIISLFGIYPTT